jgi:ABC-type microcin C transport system permease subunit YejB
MFMLMAVVAVMAATALVVQVATGGMVETVPLVMEAMGATVVAASMVKVGTAAMEVTVPLEAAEVVPGVRDLEEMGAMEIVETGDNGASKT